ncbi:hypothetical protein PFMG_03994 [Plasmodium falciparum IGH-CR14]|uniref:Uncharacterized protein n=1 Tax=Plasmodium falciparum IGH-CR14 TaxID=580059 RepID=A0A0L1IDQ6_PLAFA|nr:hypothetical protein PFMG_03994 [Plasmodium falciparum IGH-CR14]
MISSKSTDIAGLNSLRSKNINEISHLIKVTKEKKKKLCIDKNERQNIKQLENFVKEQSNCFNICKQNLNERLEKDLNEYIFFSSKNKINLNEEHIQNYIRIIRILNRSYVIVLVLKNILVC